MNPTSRTPGSAPVLHNKTRIKHKIPTHNGGNNKQYINNRVTALEWTSAEVVRGLKYILLAESSP